MKEAFRKEMRFLVSNGAVIKEEEKELLLVRRKSEGDEKLHGRWELPGGRIDFGENPEETAVREVNEETGYEVSNPELFRDVFSYLLEYEKKRIHVLITVYLCRLEGGEKDLSDQKISDIGWFTDEELKKIDTIPPAEDVAKNILK